MVTENQKKVLFKYWNTQGGPNFYNCEKVVKMFGIEPSVENIVNLFIDYYGGEDKWKQQILDFVGKKITVDEVYFFNDMEFIIDNMSLYIHGPWSPHEIKIPYLIPSVQINPFTKFEWEGKEILLGDAHQMSEEDFFKKYFPEVEKDSIEYKNLVSNYENDIVEDDLDVSGTLNSIVANMLEKLITKNYMISIYDIDMRTGNNSDFVKTIDETFLRIKQLIDFSDY